MENNNKEKETLNISELFFSIQGESTYAGLPCVFIRLSGCNLRCSWCDAKYSYNETGTSKTVEEIVAFADKYPGMMVELTGGEPLLQENVYPLLQILVDKGRTVLLETNGTVKLTSVPDSVKIIMDIKCPGSGVKPTPLTEENIAILRQRSVTADCSDEIKFVIADKNDYKWAKEMVRSNSLTDIAPVLFSPVNQTMDSTMLANSILDDMLPVRLQLQLHAFLWPGTDRGV